MTKLTVRVKTEVEVAYLKASCGVRYWEDARVNGVEDTEGKLIPLRKGDAWEPTIDLATGKIENWPQGTTAEIHYKVCDEGIYELLDAARQTVSRVDGYVIGMMCPAENGYGDYVIMKIDGTGQIEGWNIDLTEFEKGEDD